MGFYCILRLFSFPISSQLSQIFKNNENYIFIYISYIVAPRKCGTVYCALRTKCIDSLHDCHLYQHFIHRYCPLVVQNTRCITDSARVPSAVSVLKLNLFL